MKYLLFPLYFFSLQLVDYFCRKLIWRSTSLKSSLLILTAFLMFLVLGMREAAADSSSQRIVGFLAGAGGIGDQSYNDMTLAGIGKAQKDFKFQLFIQETDGTPASQERALEQLLQQGAGVIVTNGSGLGNLVERYCTRYPTVYFLVNDFPLEGYGNVASTIFAHEEGSFLIGILAASMTKSGYVGFIGGMDIPIIHSFLVGYRQGIDHVDESIRLSTLFVSSAGDYSGFINPARGRELANILYEKGVDIIFSVAGLTGNGVIQAARDQKRYVIGVDADQDHMAKGYVLTSMMKRLDKSTYRELEEFFTGKFSSGVKMYNLANGGVGLSPMTYTRDLIGQQILKIIEQAKQDIIDGKIEVSGGEYYPSNRNR